MTVCMTRSPMRFVVGKVLAPLVSMVIGTAAVIVAWPSVSNYVWPPNGYYDLTDVMVETADDLSEYMVYATRSIKRPFDGRYDIVIRRMGQSKPICDGGDSLRYRPPTGSDGAVPTIADFTLHDWTEGAKPPCVDAIRQDVVKNGPGVFEMESCIYIEEGVIIGTKRACAISVFPYPRLP